MTTRSFIAAVPPRDDIRGWRHYRLSAYASLLRDKPPLLADILHARAAAP